MKVTSEDLKALYQEGTARSGKVECLSAETMMRAAMGEVSGEERGRVADHLATCSDCSWEFRVVQALKPWAEEAGQAFAAPAEQRLHSDPATKLPPLRGVGEDVVRRTPLWQRIIAVLSPGRTPSALATQLLLLALLALGGWVILARQMNSNLNKQLADRDRALDSANKSLDEARRQLEEAIRSRDQAITSTNSTQYVEEIARLRRTIDQLTSPQLDIPVVALDMIRGGSIEAAVPIEVPKTANLFTLILNFNDRQQHSRYEVEIIDQQGSQIWQGESAQKVRANKLNVTLPRRALSGGRYLIKLFGLRNDQKVLIADYAITISYK
jgi:anti-sigma factor RsiW